MINKYVFNEFTLKIKYIFCMVILIILAACTEEPVTSSSIKQQPTIPEKLNYFLKDSGILWAGKSPNRNQEDCRIGSQVNEQINKNDMEAIIQNQDCMQGKDRSASEAMYQKISDAGEVLDGSSTTWACVLDKTTGLLWESKIPIDGTYGNNGLRDADDVFTWYSNNSSNNGGAVGDWSQGLNVCAGYVAEQPMSFCNTEEFTRRVNERGLCGFKDWRLPNRFELESLVNYGNTGSRIDTTYFPGTNPEFYWSSTPGVANTGAAWVVNFRTGNTSLSSRQSSFPLRLVRSADKLATQLAR